MNLGRGHPTEIHTVGFGVLLYQLSKTFVVRQSGFKKTSHFKACSQNGSIEIGAIVEA
jgi:hypothetical protein